MSCQPVRVSFVSLCLFLFLFLSFCRPVCIELHQLHMVSTAGSVSRSLLYFLCASHRVVQPWRFSRAGMRLQGRARARRSENLCGTHRPRALFSLQQDLDARENKREKGERKQIWSPPCGFFGLTCRHYEEHARHPVRHGSGRRRGCRSAGGERARKERWGEKGQARRESKNFKTTLRSRVFGNHSTHESKRE